MPVLLNCGQQSQFSKVRREFDAGRVNPPMTCADWPVPGNLALLHPQTAYTRKPLHRGISSNIAHARFYSNDSRGRSRCTGVCRSNMLVCSSLLHIDVGYINTCHIVIKSVLNDGKYSRE